MPVGFTFHDLRHSGNTLAAASGASTRELMTRMGHSSMRAALLYQHATRERDREIADAIDQRLQREANGTRNEANGARREANEKERQRAAS
jgi:integrase